VAREIDLNLVEVFSSIQGEGPHVGATTLFVRLGGCDLRCGWCDSPGTWLRAKECRIETRSGSAEFRRVPNPVDLQTVLEALAQLEVGPGHFVSLTGGEPLLQAEAVRAVATALRARGPHILLETHGLLDRALERVVDVVDRVSMDWKFASDVRRASDPRSGAVERFDAAHARFLSVARAAPAVDVKLVVTCATTDAEIDAAVDQIARVAPESTLIVQPVTPSGPVRDTPSAERLVALCARIRRVVPRVRLIPQTHKSYGAL